MKRLNIRVFVVLLLFLMCPTSGQTKKHDFYCYDSYDEYREIKYWARRYVSVSDYDYDSGDAEYLKLCSKDPNRVLSKITCKEVVSHFNAEFERLFIQTLPFHDTEKGRDERFDEIYKKHGQKDNFSEIRRASEEAHRNSLYGPNPGAIYCIIKISRRDFPVLYEMETSVIANKDLWNRFGLEEKKLGYSTPELIVGELKHSITQQLEELHKTLKIINDCDK